MNNILLLGRVLLLEGEFTSLQAIPGFFGILPSLDSKAEDSEDLRNDLAQTLDGIP